MKLASSVNSNFTSNHYYSIFILLSIVFVLLIQWCTCQQQQQLYGRDFLLQQDPYGINNNQQNPYGGNQQQNPYNGNQQNPYSNQQRTMPRLPLAFKAFKANVTYGSDSLSFVNVTYYYDYRNKKERVDVYDEKGRFKSIIFNNYVTNQNGDLTVDSYQVKFNYPDAPASFEITCQRLQNIWQYTYGLNRMVYWAVYNPNENNISYKSSGFDGNLPYDIWGDSQSRYTYKVSTYSQNKNFARLIEAKDYVAKLNIFGEVEILNNQNVFDYSVWRCTSSQ
ncbi:hypothetical protein ABK040_003352 [Willaertia magna]